MAAEAGGDIRAGIGTRLRAARERKALTILQAAEKMHVDARTLESLEAEDFAALGAPVYARGHLRHYAELVGESPAELQELYASSTKLAPSQPDLTRIPRAAPESDSGKLVGPAVIGLIAVAAIGTVWWVLSLSGDKAQPTPVRSAVENNSTGKPAEAARADATGAEAAATDADDDTPVALPAPEEPEPSASRGQKNGAGPGAKGATPTPASAVKTATSTTITTPVTLASTVTAPPPAPRGKDGELTLKFSSDSWAEVYDASGQRLFYDMGAASSAHTVRGPAPLRVVLGNASGVAVEYNGRPASIPPATQPDGSTRFVINAHGRIVPASTASDGG